MIFLKILFKSITDHFILQKQKSFLLTFEKNERKVKEIVYKNTDFKLIGEAKEIID